MKRLNMFVNKCKNVLFTISSPSAIFLLLLIRIYNVSGKTWLKLIKIIGYKNLSKDGYENSWSSRKIN